MQTHHIRLIDNSYDLKIAEQLLDRFIKQKIEFIEDRIKETNSNEKAEIAQLEDRISDLHAERRSLDLMLEENHGEHVEMEIGCTIVFSIKKTEIK